MRAFSIDKSDMNVIAFSPDSKLLASGEAVWDIKSGQVARQLKGMSEMGHVSFSPDGTLLAMGGFPAEVTLWDVSSGQDGAYF